VQAYPRVLGITVRDGDPSDECRSFKLMIDCCDVADDALRALIAANNQPTLFVRLAS